MFREDLGFMARKVKETAQKPKKASTKATKAGSIKAPRRKSNLLRRLLKAHIDTDEKK